MTKDKVNRIFFSDSPYPTGHKIKEFNWHAELNPKSGIWFHLHLKTENYNAEDTSEDPEDFEPASDWDSKMVWNNYHRCTISSTYWGHDGIKVGKKKKKMNFAKMDGFSTKADKLPRSDDFDHDDDPAFGIYLLGHDDCAGHRLSLKQKEDGKFDLDWSGKIALAYAGDYEFRYDFTVFMTDVEFGGLHYPAGLSKKKLKKALEKYAVNYESVVLVEKG